MSRALHLVTTGATYTASDPLLSNLFSEILPTPEETVASALRIAGEIAASTSTVSTKVMRDLMYRAPGSAEEAHLLESKVFLGRDAPIGWPWWEAVDVSSKTKL
ncbi:hypothetical protein RU639_006063 [Aspergillus parasiticus]